MLLREAYAAFNTQDVDRLLALLSDDVDWPEGSNRLHGKAAVRAYWLDQWSRIRSTHDEPEEFTQLSEQRTAVRIAQVVRALDGSIVSRETFTHVHQIKDAHIARLDIMTAADEQLATPSHS